MSWQSRFGGREWRVSRYGVVSRTPGSDYTRTHRTAGQPLTVMRYLQHWREPIVRVSQEEGAPVAIILATLAAENGTARIVGGEPYVRPPRKEPGYLSDEETPHRISVGPCHVLISTARAAMGDPSIGREWLLDLENNLRASFRALRQKDERWGHGYDPVLAAAAYNSGGLYDASNPSSRFYNHWHLRCHVRQNGRSHIGILADWYGDAAFVLEDEVADPMEDHELRAPPAPKVKSPPWPERLWQKATSMFHRG
jgi:hypothetical protein